MESKIKNGLFIFFLVIVLAPIIQQFTSFVTSGPLYGFSPASPDIDFSWSGWFEGSYQEKKGKYLNDGTGFRPDLIRFNNQLDYSLLKKLHSWKVVEGDNHYLFMDTYINDYYGRDYMGYDSILKKMNMLKALDDTLAHLGKSLILVHAPAKEFMYPEFIPGIFKTSPRTVTNLETYRRIGDSLHINQIDFNAWFCSLKNTSKELLYTRQGVHWSVYGSYLAADSLIHYIERLRNIRMPHPVWTKIEHTDKPGYSDDDIAKTLNLIYPITTETFSYPDVSYPDSPGMVKPRVIYVGDSFLPIWINDGIMDHTNTNWQVWQWFGILWSDNSRDGTKKVQDTDWINALNNTDCLVIMYTSFNLPALGNGFIEKAYAHYFPRK